MKLIVITSPEFFLGEAFLLNTLLEHGVDSVHVRKPQSTRDSCKRLLDEVIEDCQQRGISPQLHLQHLVFHDHHDLCTEYHLQGIHLNSRNPDIPMDILQANKSPGYHYTLSASCHSIQEVKERKNTTDYLFLSPIFDSISKDGYRATYTKLELQTAAEGGIIDAKVIALGGITPARIEEIKALDFGGAALLGDIWRHKENLKEFVEILTKLRHLMV